MQKLRPAVARIASGRPPPLVLAAGVLACLGVLPGLLFAVWVVLTLGFGLAVLGHPRLAVVLVVLPVVLGYGAFELVARRSRRPLLAGGVLVATWIAWVSRDAVLDRGEVPPEVVLLLGPGLAPFLALAPSVARWLRAAPEVGAPETGGPAGAGQPAGVRVPPEALLAAVLGLVTAAVPAAAGPLAVWAVSGSRTATVLVLAVTVGLAGWLLTGAVLLLAGRSWLVLALPTGGIAALMCAGTLLGGLGGGPYGFGSLSVLVPAAAAVLSALPVTRSWVSARRGTTLARASRPREARRNGPPAR